MNYNEVMKKILLLLLLSLGLIGNSYSELSGNTEVAINSLRCSAMFYSQSAIPEKAKLASGYGQLFQQIYGHHFEDITGKNLSYGDLSEARGQALLEISNEYSEESEGDYIIAQEFRHCVYWLQDIGMYFNTIETDFPEIHTTESALEEKQIYLSIPKKSSTTEFNDDISLWDETLLEGLYLWAEMGAPLSFSDQLDKEIESRHESN